MLKLKSERSNCTESGTVQCVFKPFPNYSVYLYLLTLIQAPEMIAVYSLNYSPQYIRHLLRQRFEANRHVTDLRAINVLLLKSRQEYQETLNAWKLPDQVLGLLLKPKEAPGQKTFLQKFYNGEQCILFKKFQVLMEPHRSGRGSD